MEKQDLLRSLPAIDRVLQSAAARALKERWLPRLVDAAVRDVVSDLREQILRGDALNGSELRPDALAARAGDALDRSFPAGVRACVNATGVVLHTGLGRAALPPAAVEALRREASGYCVVSVDREEGTRIRRETAVARILCGLTGAEAATVVNNNAAATLVALNTLAAGREACLSRGQMVEIGGSYRMPEVFEAAGVRLREVGATNRTHLRDYAKAIGPETALILRVHPSNYRVVGFTAEPSLAELVGLGREHGIPVMDDLGAGALLPLPPEPEMGQSLRDGAEVVCCSGDKLIGGPQAGILLGRKRTIDAIRKNPLFRALRVDKLTLAALEATLRLFLRPDGPGDGHPTLRMLRMAPRAVARRARALRRRITRRLPSLDVELRDDTGQAGSGSLPGETLPTTLVALRHPDESASTFARRLRLASTPVYTRIVDERVCIDPRTLLPGDDARLVDVLEEIL